MKGLLISVEAAHCRQVSGVVHFGCEVLLGKGASELVFLLLVTGTSTLGTTRAIGFIGPIIMAGAAAIDSATKLMVEDFPFHATTRLVWYWHRGQ